MSAGAGFAQGFAKSLVERLTEKRAEEARVREQERARINMLAYLKAQTDESIRGDVAKERASSELQFGQPKAGETLADVKLRNELNRTRQVGEAETGIAVDRAQQVGEVETDILLGRKREEATIVPEISQLDRVAKMATIAHAASDQALQMTKAEAEAWMDPKVNFDWRAAYDRNASQIEDSMGLTEMGIQLVKPPTNEVNEQFYLSAIESAPDARQARINLQGALAAAGAPALTGRVRDYFYNKWGEPFEAQPVPLGERVIGGMIGGMGSQLGIASGLTGIDVPGLAKDETAQGGTILPGYRGGRAAGQMAVDLVSPTAQFMAGQLDLQGWLAALQEELGIAPAMGGDLGPPPPATPAAPPSPGAPADSLEDRPWNENEEAE